MFYRGLKDFARDPSTEEILDKMVREEARQIKLLNKELEEV